MAAGLQVYDENGTLIFDNNVTTTHVLGTGTTGATDGSLTDTRIGDRRCWVIITSVTARYTAAPNFTASHNTLSWNFTADESLTVLGWTCTAAPVSFIYGVY